ncbi:MULTISPECIES: hypothetical protein [Spirosoma]|uniref:Uncharacterized protein n=1 Tax=Spirosoma sordidisoli TaxID=2502893 RepID=A0A4V1RVP9_9BACT|nr:MULTISPECIES: hypothetical protein [Spirosoma]RYC67528.1 hypothetical protein EQG79_22720 [Spirosoma sordidisoli]
MIVLLALVYTLAVGSICLVSAFAVYSSITWLLHQMHIPISSDISILLLLVCVVGAWLVYRLFFRRVWRREGFDWIMEKP